MMELLLTALSLWLTQTLQVCLVGLFQGRERLPRGHGPPLSHLFRPKISQRSMTRWVGERECGHDD